MRWRLACWFGAALAALTGGCHSCDRVESELRARENDVRELREELHRCEAYNQSLQLELKTIRGDAPVIEPDHPVAVYPLRSLTLGRQTGGRENDHGPGDDALQVVLEPRDADNQTIKVPASALITLLEVSSSGQKKPLSTWEIPPDQLSRSWRAGLLSTGYFLVLPWKEWPTTEKVRVVAALRVSDGRLFEADRDVTVRLPPPAQRRPAPEPPAPLPPPSPQPLPPPRPVEEGPVLPDPAWHRAPVAASPLVVPVATTAPPAAQILRPIR
jgi:hypothetical protein